MEKCKDILEVRKRNKLKYHDQVKLPVIPDNHRGYHISCYRKFIALSQSQRRKIDKDSTKESETEVKRPTRASSEMIESSSSAGIFKPVCLFFQQSRKRLRGVEQKLVCVETKDFEIINIKKYAT